MIFKWHDYRTHFLCMSKIEAINILEISDLKEQKKIDCFKDIKNLKKIL